MMLSYEAPVPAPAQQQSSVTSSIDNLPPATMRDNISKSDGAPLNVPAGPLTAQNTIAKVDGKPSPKQHHIWLVTGPAGCGKTTVAEHLSKSLNLPYLEGDDFHPKANIDKMGSGIPLTDADRWDWLTILRNASLEKLASGAEGVVLTCSALKRKYRDVIRVAPYYVNDVVLHFIYLHAPQEVLLQRVTGRKGHYMGASMVASQFSALEPPTAEEKDVISVDVSGTMEEIKQKTLELATQKIEETS